MTKLWISLILIILAVFSLSCKEEESPSTPTPKLILPANKTTVSYFDTKPSWDFDWEDFPYANCYEIEINNKRENFETKATVNTSAYRFSRGAAPANGKTSDGWAWKVRANVDDIWTEWSKEWTFDVKIIETSSYSNNKTGSNGHYDYGYNKYYKNPWEPGYTSPTPKKPWEPNYYNPNPGRDPLSPYYPPSVPDPYNPALRNQYGNPIAPTPGSRSTYGSSQRDLTNPYGGYSSNPSYPNYGKSNSSGSWKSGSPGIPGLR